MGSDFNRKRHLIIKFPKIRVRPNLIRRILFRQEIISRFWRTVVKKSEMKAEKMLLKIVKSGVAARLN